MKSIESRLDNLERAAATATTPERIDYVVVHAPDGSGEETYLANGDGRPLSGADLARRGGGFKSYEDFNPALDWPGPLPEEG